MFTNSSELLSHLKAIIHENPSGTSNGVLDYSSIKNIIQNSNDSLSNNRVVRHNRSQLKKINERIKKLENQGDQLLCIIYLLIDKISKLVSTTAQDNSVEKRNNSASECGKTLKKEILSYVENKHKPELTKRETDVFNLLEQGLCAKEIAKILFISETTVITHKRNLKEKFNAKNTVELISKVLGK